MLGLGIACEPALIVCSLTSITVVPNAMVDFAKIEMMPTCGWCEWEMLQALGYGLRIIEREKDNSNVATSLSVA